MPKSALANGPSKKRQIKGKTEEEYSTGKKNERKCQTRKSNWMN